MKNGFLKIFILAAFLLSLGVYGYRTVGASAEQAAPKNGSGMAMPVEALPPAVQDLPVSIDAVGTLSASESAEVRAEIAGTVKSINFSEGRPVKKGDSLIDIDDSLIRAELMKAEATYNVRKTAFARSDKLKSSGYVSSQDWEQNKGSLQEAKADIESARIRLEKSRVLAPFDGQAGLRNFSVGDYVQVGQLLTTLDAVDTVKIVFSVPEKNYGDLRGGQRISFSVDAWPGEKFAGEVYAVAPRIDRNTRNFDVKATVPNADGRLRPGMFARINIVTAVHAGALLVPEQSIIPQNDSNFVFVVRDGKAVLQKIETGLRQAGLVEVLSGISKDEPVVVSGLMKIQNGMPVVVMGTAP